MDTPSYLDEIEFITFMINEGYTREYAEEMIARKKQEAYEIGESLIFDHFPEGYSEEDLINEAEQSAHEINETLEIS